jgi:hypothetical protein
VVVEEEAAEDAAVAPEGFRAAAEAAATAVAKLRPRRSAYAKI